MGPKEQWWASQVFTLFLVSQDVYKVAFLLAQQKMPDEAYYNTFK